MFSILNEPSALLSNARSTIATLIQRPSSINTSNAFEEFSILDHLIDVSKDVDRFEDEENRKFVNIAQVITASTCIYSRRVDALYKLINNFNDNPTDDKCSSSDESENSTSTKTKSVENDDRKKLTKQQPKETSTKRRRSFISLDPDKLNYNNTSKTFFLDRTSIVDIKLFQKYVPTGNKQFWFDDCRPVIFDLLFDEQEDEENENVVVPMKTERLVDVVNQIEQMDQEIPFPQDFDDDRDNFAQPAPEKKKNRTKKLTKIEIDLNIFRRGLTDDEQSLFNCQKLKPLGTTKINSIETKDFFVKTFQRKHFDVLIKDCPSSIVSLFVFPTISIEYETIRERYSTKSIQLTSRRSRSPPMPLNEAIEHDQFLPPVLLSPIDFVEEDADLRLQTDMEQYFDTAMDPTKDEQQHNRVFLSLRSSISTYVNEHENEEKIDAEDLIASLSSEYSLALVFSQLLQFCVSTQRYSLQSTLPDRLYLEKLSAK